MEQKQHLTLKIHGMHCASCEVLIERSFKKVPGVEKVNVNHANGKATLVCTRIPEMQEFQRSIKSAEYTVAPWQAQSSAGQSQPQRNTKRDYKEIGIVFFVIVAVYIILRQYRLVPEIGVSDNMGLGFVFLIGLVAAMSTCIAVTGGLLVAVAAKYNASHPGLTGMQKFKPNLYFNIGRVVSYAVLGGAVGALGSAITLSAKAMGLVTIVASIVMVILGFQLLKLFPWMRHFQPKMPKFIAHRIHNASGSQSKMAPFFLGASTFFLPCGFTQALQLYVLSQGSITTGALTMLVFALGTLPALLSLSAVSSFARGGFQRYFLKFAGVIVILLGVFNINNGLALTGSSLSILPGTNRTKTAAQASGSADPNVQIVNGRQIVRMAINGYTYEPAQFTVQAGVPVAWEIDGTAAGGCARVVTAQGLGINAYIPSSGVKTVAFTPTKPGTYPFSCPMGMTTRGAAFVVVPNDGSAGTAVAAAPNTPAKQTTDTSPGACNPEFQQCYTQQFRMEVTREKGFYPNSFQAKKGVPVELTVDAKIPLGGCMGTMIVPDYDVAQRLQLGESVVRFTPTRTGRVLATCAMGNPLAEFVITD